MTGPPPGLTKDEAENLLCREAQLLDERRFEEWLQLFTLDGIYWIPIDERADPELEPSVVYDDAQRRAERVSQLVEGLHYAQLPPSRTLHFVSNVQVGAAERGGDQTVYCNVLVHELRPGDPRQSGLGRQRPVAASCEYRLRFEGDWRIVLKKVVLLDRDLPLQNFTFIM